MKYFLYYFSGLFSQIAFMKIPCIIITKKYRVNPTITINVMNNEQEDKPKRKKNYTINTQLHQELIDMNFKRVLRNIDNTNNKNVNYYISYLQHFHNHQISEKEIKDILKSIQTIKYSVKRDFLYFSHQYEKEIMNQIQNTQYFYVKRNCDYSVFLYKINFLNADFILKVYKYYPEFTFSQSLLEWRFENEIIFQKYANSLNQKLDFISPKIHSFGKISVIPKENDLRTNYLFIMMDYISGLTLKNIEFRPHLCKKIYEINENLKKHLLNHNDLHSNNIIINEKDDLVLLDYGESVLGGM